MTSQFAVYRAHRLAVLPCTLKEANSIRRRFNLPAVTMLYANGNVYLYQKSGDFSAMISAIEMYTGSQALFA
jgi:hypothetical protein